MIIIFIANLRESSPVLYLDTDANVSGSTMLSDQLWREELESVSPTSEDCKNRNIHHGTTHKLTTTSLAVKQFTSLAVKWSTSLAVHKLRGQVIHKLSGQAAHELSRHPAFNPISAGSHGVQQLCALLGSASSSSSVYTVVCGVVHLASSSPPSPINFYSFHCFISVTGAWNGGSWLGCGDLPAMGSVFLSRGWLATVEAPGYPRHPPSTSARQLVKSNYT